MAVQTKPRTLAGPTLRPATSSLLPPGPETGRVAQSAAFHRDPLRFLERARDRFGQVFTLRLAVAGPMVVVADPRAIDQVLASDPGGGHGGEGRRRILGMVSPDSILGADGDRHRRARQPLEPAFTSEAVSPLAQPIAAIAARHADSWPTGRPTKALSRLRSIADEIFVRLALGVRDERRAAALTAAIGRMLRTPGNPPLPVPGGQAGLVGEAGKRIFERRQAPVAALLGEEVEARREASEHRHDAISCLLRAEPDLTTEEAVDRLVPLTMAGQEPPASALTWLLDRLIRDDELATRFLADSTGDDARAIVNESLRLAPAVHSVVRHLTAELYVGGYRLPPGVTVALPILLLHRDPQVFPDPGEFRPERFADGAAPSSFIPFGGGNRACLGRSLPATELATVLPELLRRRRLRPLARRPERMVVRGTVLVPRRGEVTVAT
jgi:cytochrome P450